MCLGTLSLLRRIILLFPLPMKGTTKLIQSLETAIEGTPVLQEGDLLLGRVTLKWGIARPSAGEVIHQYIGVAYLQKKGFSHPRSKMSFWIFRKQNAKTQICLK